MFKAAFNFIFSKPVAALCIVIGIGYGIIEFQDWIIHGLKTENKKLETTVKVERKHTAKVVTAFEDKEVKGNDRHEFKRAAAAAIAAKSSGEAPAPVVRDAYQRMFTRLHARTAEDAR